MGFNFLWLNSKITHQTRHEITGSLGRAEGRRDLFETELRTYIIRAEDLSLFLVIEYQVELRIYSLRAEDI